MIHEYVLLALSMICADLGIEFSIFFIIFFVYKDGRVGAEFIYYSLSEFLKKVSTSGFQLFFLTIFVRILLIRFVLFNRLYDNLVCRLKD